MNMYRLSLLSKLFLQAGVTNGDYEAAGISGQLDVVTLDTYNESEGQTDDAVSGPNLIAVIVPSVATALVILIIFVILTAVIW